CRQKFGHRLSAARSRTGERDGWKAGQCAGQQQRQVLAAMAPSVPLLRSVLRHGAGFVAAALIVSTAQSAEVATMKIERVVSPGGIEAWLGESPANPLIAMRFAFRGGAAQDPNGKDGLAYFISSMMDEGAGPLDAIAFQEREQALAMRMDFDASPAVMPGTRQPLP